MGISYSLKYREGENKSSFVGTWFSFFLLYISIYGTVSIYVDNILFRSLKDVVLLIMVAYGLLYCIRKELVHPLLTYVYVSLYVVSLTSLLISRDFLAMIYGVKITLLPIGMLYFGAVLANRLNIKKLLFCIYLLLVSSWLIQYFLGIERLMDLGFVYGVNIKHFYGLLRLPSTVGAPDNYALYIGIIGAWLSNHFNGRGRLILLVITTILVTLSTLRTAILFWIVYLLFIFFKRIKNTTAKGKSLSLSMVCFFSALIIMIAPLFIRTSYASTKSIIERVANWSSNIQPINSAEGIVGNGIGVVGAASRRIADLNINSLDYAVDNQYIAMYQQLGIAGLFFFVMLILMCCVLLKKREATESLAILTATAASCFVTNTIELFPFNILFWTLVGMNLNKGISIPNKERVRHSK